MVRPPCCDKLVVKKGPWTPEEDIVLVTYINEHGPGNWRAVPIHTGLQRCSKSCRLRYTNYLRPNIKRGNFNEQEERMIIHLQALLGNSCILASILKKIEGMAVKLLEKIPYLIMRKLGWAAIASYLPQRTDNDIKNYWNTHLKKKLKKLHGLDDGQSEDGSTISYRSSASKGQWERRVQTNIHSAKQELCEALSLDKSINLNDLKPPINDYYLAQLPPANDNYQAQIPPYLYATSTANIAKLLPNWMKASPKSSQKSSQSNITQLALNKSSEGFEPLFSFASSNSDGSQSISVNDYNANMFTPESNLFQGDENKPVSGQGEDNQEPFTMLEKWLFDDGAAQGQVDQSMDATFHNDLF